MDELRLTDNSSPPDREPGAKLKDDALINKYEDYRSDLRATSLLALKGEGTAAIISNLQELGTIYSSVGRSSGSRVRFADAQALKDTSSVASINAKNIKSVDAQIALDPEEIITKAQFYLSGGSPHTAAQSEVVSGALAEEKFNRYNWIKLGVLFHKVSSKPIPMEFLNGPIEIEKKTRARNRNIDDTKGLKTSTAQQVTVEDLGNDDQSTSNLVRAVFRNFKSKQHSNPQPINFFKFFIDPMSFSQSVENLFFTSFLVRDARVQLVVGDDDIPVIKIVDEKETRRTLEDRVGVSNHHISTFDYDTWEEMIKVHGITESYLGHRTVEGETFIISESESESEESSDEEDFIENIEEDIEVGDVTNNTENDDEGNVTNNTENGDDGAEDDESDSDIQISRKRRKTNYM